MTMEHKLLAILLVLCATFGAGVGYGHHLRDLQAKADDLKRAEAANVAWAERFTLAGQLATRDMQLAQAQKQAATTRTVTVIKREVIYHDRIKDPNVRDAVRDSGLLEYYNATLGLPVPSGGPASTSDRTDPDPLDPDAAPVVMKHNADALLGDRDRLIRLQQWYQAQKKKPLD